MNSTSNTPAAPAIQPILTLQFLRAMAALMVVLAHAIDYQQAFLPGPSALTSFFYLENFGAVGVDIFFIVSGFIMATIVPDAGGDRVALRFALKRIFRIVPIYWFLTIITAILAAPGSITLPRLIASFTFVPIYPQGAFLPPVILAGWTLSFELYFYLLIVASLAIRKRGSVVPGVAGVLAALAIAGIVLRPTAGITAFFLNPMLGEFALGCVIGHFYRRRQPGLQFGRASCVLACGVLCLLATLILGFGSISEVQDTMMGYAGATRVLIWGLPCAMVVAGLVFNERRWRNWIPRALLLVGDASYSIYLIQLIAIRQFAVRWSLAGIAHPDLFIGAAVIFAVLAGIANYGIVEKPLVGWLGKSARGPVHIDPPRQQTEVASEPKLGMCAQIG